MNPLKSAPIQVVPGILAQLGEGLHWDASRQTLWMTDIQGRRLWRVLGPRTDAPTFWTLEHRVGWVIPTDEGQSLLLGLQPGFARVPTPGSGQALAALEWVCRPFGGKAAMRLNDAKADSSGAVWAGSMNNENESGSEGQLFRLAPDGTLGVADTGYAVANGPAIREDERLLLHTDSARRTIYAFDLDVAGAILQNKRPWLRFDDQEGFPDGMCFDAEGCLWVAHWGGGCVTRRDPEGRVIRRIDLPAPNVTNVCFAGAGLDRLFVTTAQVGLDAQALASSPLSGSLFEVDAQGVRGLPGRPARIAAAAP
jgi:xylono-1,5-lactonase